MALSIISTGSGGNMVDVAILGAGVCGLTIATEIARRGGTVRLHDPAGEPGAHGCSWWAGGMLAPHCERESAEEAVVRLGAEAADWWEAQAGGRKKKAILGDVMEALLGALYIDGGLEAARGVYNQFWTPNLEDLSKAHKDPKTALQEWSQNKKLGTPDYNVLHSEGPAHAPAFKIEVQVKKFKPATGEGRSKRAAQMAAARAFLKREGVWSEND